MQRLSLRVDHSVCSSGIGNSVSKELASLHSTLKELRQEIQTLKTRPPLRSALRTPTVTFENITNDVSSNGGLSLGSDTPTSTDYFSARSNSGSSTVTDYFSAISSDDEEEFYDLPPESTEDLPYGPKEISCEDSGGQVNQYSQFHTKSNGVIDQYISHAERLSSEIEKLKLVEETDEEREKRKEIVQLFETVDGYMEGQAMLQKKAYAILTEKDEPPLCDNGEFLWRLCKSTYLMAVTVGQEGDLTQKQELIFRAVDHGQRAIDVDEDSSEAHKWYAIAIGSRGEYLGIKEKILDGFEFKKHIDLASELAPQDHTIRHLLGR